MIVTQPIRDEHKDLLPHIESLRTCAEMVDQDGADIRAAVGDVLDFLRHHLIPHAQAEDAALYPTVEKVMRAPGATATMRRDHQEVIALTEELAGLRESLSDPPGAQQRRDLQRVLYGLYGIVRLHFAKEEEVYLPILDAGLPPEQAELLISEMHHAVAHGGAHSPR